METNQIGRNIIRFVVIALLQVLVLRRITPTGLLFPYVSFIIYPILFVLLPYKTPKILLLFIGLFLGLFLDFFYNTLGVHAGACVATAFFRPYLLELLLPRGGYNLSHNLVPANYGHPWFLRYAGILVFAHLLIYFSFLLFSPIYSGQILLRTLASFIFSMLFIYVYGVFGFGEQPR